MCRLRRPRRLRNRPARFRARRRALFAGIPDRVTLRTGRSRYTGPRGTQTASARGRHRHRRGYPARGTALAPGGHAAALAMELTLEAALSDAELVPGQEGQVG